MGVVADLTRKLGVEDEIQACRELVRLNAIRPNSKSHAVDLTQLAGQLGIVVRSVDADAYDGQLSWDASGKATICFSRRANRKRQRFTVAHEIGHWLLINEIGGPKTEPLFRGLSVSKADISEEERLANLIAAEILLPHETLHPLVEGSVMTMSLIRHIAKVFEVSKMAVLRRISDVADCPMIYINAVPYRFSDPDSAIEIDDALYATPRKGILYDREKTRFIDRMSYAHVAKGREIEIRIKGPKGNISAVFDVTENNRPMPNVDLLAIKCRPLDKPAELFLNSAS